MNAASNLIIRAGGFICLTFLTQYFLRVGPPMLGGLPPIILPTWAQVAMFLGFTIVGKMLLSRVVRPILIFLLLTPFFYFHLEFLAKALKWSLTPEIKWVLRLTAISLSGVVVTWGGMALRWLGWKFLWVLFSPFRAVRAWLGPKLKRWYYRVRGYPPCPIDISLDQIDRLGNGDTYLKGKYFEEYIAQVYQILGHDAKTTGQLRDLGALPPSIQARGGSGEQGVDVVVPVAESGQTKKILVQCKHYSKKVDNSAIQEIVSAMPLYQGDQAVVITNNYFTKPAIELAAANGVLLIDRPVLQKLIKNAVQKYAADQKAA